VSGSVLGIRFKVRRVRCRVKVRLTIAVQCSALINCNGNEDIGNTSSIKQVRMLRALQRH